MQLQLEAGQVVFRVEVGDTVDGVAGLIDLLSGAHCTQRVADDGTTYAIHIQPGDNRLPFVVVVPKVDDIDGTLLALCSAYLSQQDLSD